jgi:hypothetical protein
MKLNTKIYVPMYLITG